MDVVCRCCGARVLLNIACPNDGTVNEGMASVIAAPSYAHPVEVEPALDSELTDFVVKPKKKGK